MCLLFCVMAANASNEFKFNVNEIKRLEEAFKDDNFRKLFAEYAEEINDPENQRKYEEDITALEKERGIDTTFIHPEPGYVLKTSVNGEKKAFLNICKNKHVGKASCSRSQENHVNGYSWNIPYFMSPPREDLDKSGKLCTVYDVIFHPDTYYMADKNTNFRKMIEDTALAGVEDKFSVVLDRKNVRHPKMKFKGRAVPTVIRTKSQNCHDSGIDEGNDLDPVINMPYPYGPPDEVSKNSKLVHIVENSSENGPISDKDLSTVPKYSIKYRNHVDMQDYSLIPNTCTSTRPNEIVVEIDLPLLNSADAVDLEIFQKRLLLKCNKQGALYHLDLNLAYPVDENTGKAKFDKNKKKLTVTLPVIPLVMTVFPGGIESIAKNDTNSEEIECEMEAGATDSSVASSSDLKESAQSVVGQPSSECINTFDNSHKCNVDSLCLKSNGYFLPEFQCNQTENMLALVLQVRNVDPSSVKVAHCGCHSAYQVVFTSLGEGFVPFQYSLCLKFDRTCIVNPKDCSVNVTENNVVLRLVKKEECQVMWTDFFVGTNNTSLQKYEALSESFVIREMKQLKEEGEHLFQKGELLRGDQVIVGDVNAQHISFNIKLEPIAECNIEEIVAIEEVEEPKKEGKISTQKEERYISGAKSDHINFAAEQNLTDSGSDVGSPVVGIPPKSLLPTTEDQSPSQRKRGILKYPRNWRTVSESSDEMCFSPLDTTPIETDNMLGLVSEDQEDKPKKSVRFSDQVARNVFRANSSILGQRKKNQRKAKNKKKKSPTKTNEGSDSAESETWDSGEGSDCNSVSETDSTSTLSQDTKRIIKTSSHESLTTENCSVEDGVLNTQVVDNVETEDENKVEFSPNTSETDDKIDVVVQNQEVGLPSSYNDIREVISKDKGENTRCRSRRERRQAKKQAKWEKKNGKRGFHSFSGDRTVKESDEGLHTQRHKCDSLVVPMDGPVSNHTPAKGNGQNHDSKQHPVVQTQEELRNTSHEVKLQTKSSKDEFCPDSMLSWDEESHCKSDLQTVCAINLSNNIMFQLD